MKVFATILKIFAALAAIAGVVYVVATYGDKIVAWAKKTLGIQSAENCCGCEDCEDCQCDVEDCADCPCQCECPVEEDETIEEDFEDAE